MIGIFGDLSYAAIGGVATRLYMPERTTQDLDILVIPEDLEALRSRLGAQHADFLGKLAFPDSTMGLEGETWQIPGSQPLDVIWSGLPWARRAVAAAKTDQTGLKIVPLWALVALKLDASRGVDQGDLSRMLGLASDQALDEVRTAVLELMPAVAEDLESYIVLGRLEVGRAAEDSP